MLILSINNFSLEKKKTTHMVLMRTNHVIIRGKIPSRSKAKVLSRETQLPKMLSPQNSFRSSIGKEGDGAVGGEAGIWHRRYYFQDFA